MNNKKEYFLIFIVTFMINLSLIVIFMNLTNKSFKTYIKFSTYDYECVGIFDDAYENDNSFKKTKSFYRVSSIESTFAYLYFEKNVNYYITPNVTNALENTKKLMFNECAISSKMAEMLKINVGDFVQIDAGGNMYTYKVAYLFNSDYSFYNSKVKDIYDIILGENDNISKVLDCQEILFCSKKLLDELVNNDKYSIRSVFYLRDEKINSMKQNYMLIIFIIITFLIDLISVKVIYYSKEIDYIIDFYSNINIKKINKSYIKYYLLYHILPCLSSIIVSFVFALILKINIFIVIIYMITIFICMILNYGGFIKLWKKKC